MHTALSLVTSIMQTSLKFRDAVGLYTLLFAKIQLISNQKLTIITPTPFVHLIATGRGHCSNNFGGGLLDLLYFPSLTAQALSAVYRHMLQKPAENMQQAKSAPKNALKCTVLCHSPDVMATKQSGFEGMNS